MLSVIMTAQGIGMYLNGQSHNIPTSHPNYEAIVDAIKRRDEEGLVGLVDIPAAIERFSFGKVKVTDGAVYYGEFEVHNTLTSRILRMLREGFNIEPLVKFMDRLMQNPSKRAVDELYGFLEAGQMPITEDGYFLAYKRVNADFTSVHDGKTDNSIGKIVEMPRNQVDDNRDRTCSSGLHFCSKAYLSYFSGDKVIVLKIDPADVVSIPSDYNDAKGRACRYLVLGELENGIKDSVFQKSVARDADLTNVIEDDDDTTYRVHMSALTEDGGFCTGYVDVEASSEDSAREDALQQGVHDHNHWNGDLDDIDEDTIKITRVEDIG